MNGLSDVLPQDAAAPIAQPRPLYWSIRRELWENRYLYVAPLVVTAVVLFATLASLATLSHRLRAVPVQDAAKQQAMLIQPFHIAPAPIMFASLMIGLFYCLDALYGERRDRSILFWKSLPVSDRTTVLAKTGIPLLVMPLLAFALSVVTQAILLFLGTVMLLGSHRSPAALWGGLHFFQGLLIMVYGLTVYSLWLAPVYGWLLMISAWARRAVFLWAVLPLLVISAVEKIALNSMHFMRMLQYRMTGAMTEAFVLTPKSRQNIDRLSQLDPVRFLTSPGLWLGLLFAAACIACAIRLRRNREPI
jgi:ABC-2 type transport system permease protein